MGIRPISPARWAGAGAPLVTRGLYKTSEAIVLGSILNIDANGELVVCGDDTNTPVNATIAGVALEAAGTAPGYSIGQTDVGGTSVFTGRSQKISYAVANLTTVFRGVFSADGIVVTAPTQTLVGESYRLSKTTAVPTGTWYLLSSDQTPANVIIVGIDTDINEVFFKFTAAALQF